MNKYVTKLVMLVGPQLVELLLAMYTPEQIKEFLDAVIDKAEDKIILTENKVDDVFLLPVLKTVRAAFSIPDND